MKELELKKEASKPSQKLTPVPVKPPAYENLKAMSTDELVKLLMSPEMAQPANAAVRQQIIKILQDREGNAFVQRLIGKSPEKK